MPNIFNEPLRELEVARLLKHIRGEEDKEHIADFCADISAEFARIARYVGKVGFSLSEKWKSADHMVLAVKDYRDPLLAIHIRSSDANDQQTIDISYTMKRKRTEVGKERFYLPYQFQDAKNHLMGQLFAAFPHGALIAPEAKDEEIPMFEPPVLTLPPTWDEAIMKERAFVAANEEGESKVIRLTHADRNQRTRSFSR